MAKEKTFQESVRKCLCGGDLDFTLGWLIFNKQDILQKNPELLEAIYDVDGEKKDILEICVEKNYTCATRYLIKLCNILDDKYTRLEKFNTGAATQLKCARRALQRKNSFLDLIAAKCDEGNLDAISVFVSQAGYLEFYDNRAEICLALVQALLARDQVSISENEAKRLGLVLRALNNETYPDIDIVALCEDRLTEDDLEKWNMHVKPAIIEKAKDIAGQLLQDIRDGKKADLKDYKNLSTFVLRAIDLDNEDVLLKKASEVFKIYNATINYIYDRCDYNRIAGLLKSMYIDEVKDARKILQESQSDFVKEQLYDYSKSKLNLKSFIQFVSPFGVTASIYLMGDDYVPYAAGAASFLGFVSAAFCGYDKQSDRDMRFMCLSTGVLNAASLALYAASQYEEPMVSIPAYIATALLGAYYMYALKEEVMEYANPDYISI